MTPSGSTPMDHRGPSRGALPVSPMWTYHNESQRKDWRARIHDPTGRLCWCKNVGYMPPRWRSGFQGRNGERWQCGLGHVWQHVEAVEAAGVTIKNCGFLNSPGLGIEMTTASIPGGSGSTLKPTPGPTGEDRR